MSDRCTAFSALYDAVTVPLLLHQGGNVLHANPPMLRLLGCSLEEIRQWPHEQIVAEDDRERLREYGQECLSPSSGEVAALVMTVCSRSGARRAVELAARRVAIDGVATAVITVQDLSDIQFVQDSMQQLSQLLGQIINGGPLATFVISADHRLMHWNQACERLTGWMASDLRGGTDTWKAFYPTQRPLLADFIVDEATEEQLSAAYQGRCRRSVIASGAWEVETFFPTLGDDKLGRWLYFTAAPLRDAAGHIIGAVETLQDVSERLKTEEELRRHRNELEALVAERSAALHESVQQLGAFMQNAPVGVAQTANGVLLQANHKLATLFGYSDEELNTLHEIDFFFEEEHYKSVRREAIPVLTQGNSWQGDRWMRHRDNTALWVQLIAYPADPKRPELGTWWLLQDRTDVRRAQDELQENFERIKETNRKLEEAQNQLLQSDKMASIGQLAAGVAHEINNPIGFVSSNLHTLKAYVGDLLDLIGAYEAANDGQQDLGAQSHLVEVRERVEMDYLREDLPQLMTESADGLARVKKIVQDLKDFSRVDQAEWQEADLNAGVESTLNVVMHEVKYKAEIRKALTPIPLVRCLAAQLNQVFMNLIVNASHAIDGRGVITLSSGQVDDWVWVEVADTGCGMPLDVQRRIFEPFYTTKPVGKGTGLGLSLSFSIVQKHGGSIQVKSELGKGSAFRVWVPIGGPTTDGVTRQPPIAVENGELGTREEKRA
jgi:two-component system, NtrC family, sensor kinase